MLPSIELRIQNLVKALSQVVLPAIDPGNGLAREQAQLVIAHLHLIAQQWTRAPAFEAGSLAALQALAERLADLADGGRVTSQAGAELRSALGRDFATLGNAVARLIVATGEDGAPAFRAQLDEQVLEYGAHQAWRERVWFAGSGLDPDRASLPSIDEMLRREAR